MAQPPQWQKRSSKNENTAKKESKNAKKTVQRPCTGCSMTGTLSSSSFQQCSECKKLYCSEECQTRDWPRHRAVCMRPSPFTASQDKAWANLICNPTLSRHFKILTVLHLNLHRLSPEEHAGYMENPFEVDIYVQIEPADIKHFLRLYDPSARLGTTAMKGMPQLQHISIPQRSTLTPEEIQDWEDSRLLLLENARAENRASSSQSWESIVGFIHFYMMVNGDKRKFIRAGMTRCEINSDHIECVRKEKPFMTPILPGYGLLIDLPMSANSYMEFINNVIRLDDKNDWSLRCKMSRADKDLIRRAASSMSDPIRLLRPTPSGQSDERANLLPGRPYFWVLSGQSV